MCKLRTFLAVILLSIMPVLAFAQQPPTPTPAQFRAQIQKVAANAPLWQKTIDAIKIDDLSISYAVGKRFDENKQLVTDELKVLTEWAGNVLNQGGIFDEVCFLSSIQGFQSGLQQLGDWLNQFQIKDRSSQNKLNGWTQALSDLASGPVNDAFTSSYLFTTDHACQLQKSCAATAAKQAQ